MPEERLATNHCRICGEELNELNGNNINIKQDRGAKNINSCARLCGLVEWDKFVKKGDSFREECRKDFVKKDRIMSGPTTMEITRLELRSESKAIKKFDYRTCCLFCCAPL